MWYCFRAFAMKSSLCLSRKGPALAFEPLDARLDLLLALAHWAHVTLVVGAPVRLAGRLHLGAAVLDADGGLEWYTERHLGAFGPEALADALEG
jgi:hypothetical protein